MRIYSINTHDMEPTTAQPSAGTLAMFPSKGAAFRGGIDASVLTPVDPTSTAYKGVAGASSITFEVASSGNEMIDLSECFFETQVVVQRLRQGGGGNYGAPTTGDRISLKNAAASLMWSRCEVRVNGTSVADQLHNTANWGPGAASWFDKVMNKSAPYGAFSQAKALLVSPPNTGNADEARIGEMGATADSAVVGYTGSQCGGSAQLEGFAFADAPAQARNAAGDLDGNFAMNIVTAGENDTRPAAAAKTALNQPLLLSRTEDPTTLIYKPALSLFQQPVYLPPGTRVSVTLFKNPDHMFIQSDIIEANTVATSLVGLRANYQLCRMWVKRIQPSEPNLSLVKSYLEAAPYEYQFVARRAWSDSIAAGASYRAGGILQGPMPSVVFVFFSRGLVSSSLSHNARCSPWAMSPSSLVAGNDAAAGAGPSYASLGIPQVKELYLRVGGQQFPREPIRMENSIRADGFRAYAMYLDAARKGMFGKEQAVLSMTQFLDNYLFFVIPMAADPLDPIAGSISSSTASLASSSGIEIVVQFTAAVADPEGVHAMPSLRIAAIAESPASVIINGQGGVSRVGF